MRSSAPSASNHINTRKIIPLLLIGSGMILLGVVSFVLLPKPRAAAQKGKQPVYAIPVAVDFPVWPDPGLRALASFHNDALPSSYVLDRDGQVRLAWSGPISRELLEKYVTPLLEE